MLHNERYTFQFLMRHKNEKITATFPFKSIVQNVYGEALGIKKYIFII